MRWLASDDCAGSPESAASAAPEGGPASTRPDAVAAKSTTPASAAIAQLAERSPTCLVEEMQILRVDRDRHDLPQLELDVRRERRDEVRTLSDDGLRVLGREHLLLFGLVGLDPARVDMEVGHRLAAERLDQVDARLDLRQVVAPLRRIEVARADA